MLPDVIDAAALERGVRREELFYAYFVFGNKFAGGVTLGISTGIYKYEGQGGMRVVITKLCLQSATLLYTVPFYSHSHIHLNTHSFIHPCTQLTYSLTHSLTHTHTHQDCRLR